VRIAAVFVAGVALLAAPALADDIPQLTGTWKGPGDGVNLKHGFLPGGDVTIVVTEQQGRVFKAEITYPRGDKAITEPLVGSIDVDGDRIMMIGDNGTHIAEYDDGVIENCYQSPDSGTIACMELKKQ
jgi:hypothetical protein